MFDKIKINIVLSKVTLRYLYTIKYKVGKSRERSVRQNLGLDLGAIAQLDSQ